MHGCARTPQLSRKGWAGRAYDADDVIEASGDEAYAQRLVSRRASLDRTRGGAVPGALALRGGVDAGHE